MGKAPCCSKVGLHKGPWSTKEDMLLTKYIQENGEGQWRSMPKKAGLLRCGKSCRLRWMNYLRPGIKRGNISPDEEDLIVRLHSLLGNRWSLIAGRLPGRTDNEIKNYWNTHLVKRLKSSGVEPKPNKTVAKRPKKESKRKSRAVVGSETTGVQKKQKKNSKNNNNNNVSIDGKDPNADCEAVVEKVKIYVPKPIRVGSAVSLNNSMNSGLSSSSGSHEEVNKAAGEDMVCHFDDQNGKAEMSDFDWPLIELGDANYGSIHVCKDDQVLIEGCDFMIHDSMPIIGNMLEQVYDEYLQLL